ncbi:MAG: cytochrome P450 [Chloroflexota bacterium]
MQSQSEYDQLLSGETFHQNPHQAFHQLREQVPVYWSELWQAWVITRYDNVMSVLRQPKQFSSAGRVSYLLDSLDESIRADLTRLEKHYDIGLAHTDPPDHTRLRSLLNKVFTPRMVETWRPRIETVTQQLIDTMLEQSQPDIIRDIAYPLPATIIAEMIGASPDDIPLFRDWAVDINRLFELGGRMSEEAARNAQNSLTTMREYIMQLVTDREKSPQDDIVGRLVSAEEKLSIDELVSTCVTLFVAGHETTTNLISNGMYLLLTHPEQLSKLQQNPELIESAIEEILRYEPSVPRAWRIVREETVINEQTIDAGSLIFPILSSANRDPQHFQNPDTFDITRQNNKQLAFGYGIHFCSGAPLARVEGAITIDTIIKRLPDIHLSNQPQWRPDVAIRALDSIQIIQG